MRPDYIGWGSWSLIKPVGTRTESFAHMMVRLPGGGTTTVCGQRPPRPWVARPDIRWPVRCVQCRMKLAKFNSLTP